MASSGTIDPSDEIGFIGVASPYDSQGPSTQGNSTENENPPPLEDIIPKQGNEQTQAPQGMPQPQPSPMPKARPHTGFASIIVLLVIIAIIAAGALIFVSHKAPSTTTIATTASTTVPAIKMTEVTGCMNISSPGRYYFGRDIKVNISTGPCIDIKSSNVELVGNGNNLTGSGPYSGVPPFTYGILASNVGNVTIYNLGVNYFSYGIFLNNVKGSYLKMDTMNKDTMSGIYLNNSSGNLVNGTYISGVSSKEGALFINGGSSNKISNVTAANNAYYGISVNSTGNSFVNDTLYNNPTDLICYSSAGLRDSNYFKSTKCVTNDYCNFAQCSTTNLPFNITRIKLSSNIDSCGGIYTPGTFNVGKDLIVNDYVNTSNPLSSGTACISILSPSVTLNCNGHSIINGNIGINASNFYNVTLENCNVQNNTYGIYLSNAVYPRVYNTSLRSNYYGMMLNGISTMGSVNVTGVNNTYGIYISSTTGLVLNKFNLKGNEYGIYMDSGNSNSFNSGTLLNNSKGDLYCTATTYNSTYNLLENAVCGVTDCNWGASCAQHVPPPISIYPITNCKTITYPGSYSINNNIIGSGKCINIETSNVNINCNNHIIEGPSSGSAIFIANQSNVSISSCRITSFATGINVSNSNYVSVQYMNISKVAAGVSFYNSSYSKIMNMNVTGFSSAGYAFDKLDGSIITSDSASDGLNSGSGFILINSTGNLVSFNNAVLNGGNGIEFAGSNGNNVFNNTAYQNTAYDYYCNSNSSGVYANTGNPNFGNSKYGCKWLVELTPLTLMPNCYAISSASSITLTSDMLYGYGNTCFNVYNTPTSSANYTVINCNGHTVLATHGGTFVNVLNATNVKIENCYILNFSKAISSSASYINVVNNTIASSNFSILVGNSRYPYIENNRILNASYGIMLENSNYGKILNNSIADTRIPIQLSGGSAFIISDNRATGGTIGMYMINSTINILQDNVLTNMSKYGIDCTKSIENSSSLNKDYGGNICSSNNDCYWMSASPSCMPS